MALAFPFAIHYALYGDTRRTRQIYALLTLLIAAAIPATVSRTGFVALAIVVVILVPLWGWRTRYNIAIMGAGLSAVLIAAKPSLASTLITMFETVGSDESITSRTDRYDMVYDYFVERPWFGRGSGTWVSPQYQYLDNQWLSMVLTNGIVGVAVLVAIHVTAIVLATVAMRRATDDCREAHRGRAGVNPARRDRGRRDVRLAELHHLRDHGDAARRALRRRVAAHPPGHVVRTAAVPGDEAS